MISTDAVDVGVLLLRLLLGLTLAAHGWDKFFGKGGVKGRAAWFESIGMKPGLLNARASATVELLAGLALAAGLLTPLAAAGFMAVMAVAIVTVGRRGGFFITAGGFEYNMVLAVAPLGIALIGPGRFSLDQILFAGSTVEGVFSGWVGFAIAAGLGILGALGQLAIFYRPGGPAATGGR